METNGATHPNGAELGGEPEVVISAEDVTVAFGDKVVLDKLSLDVRRGEILGFVGASGAGKSVLLRTILGLTRKRSGKIRIFGIDLDTVGEVLQRTGLQQFSEAFAKLLDLVR